MEKVNLSNQDSRLDHELDHEANSLVSDRVEHQLRERIKKLNTGTMLPPQAVLVRELGASRHTIREAMDRLKQDRLIQSTRGRGTFVASSRRTKTTVHLISSSMHHVYNLMCIGVLTEVLRERGHLVHLVGSQTPGEEWQDIVGNHEHSAGAILVGMFTRKELKPLMESCHLPLVHLSDIDEPYRRPPLCDTVINDNAAMAFQATEYLIQQGHRRIALAGWSYAKIWDREMRRGYEEALRAHDIEPQDEWVLRLPEKTSPDTGLAMEKNVELETRARAQIEQWRASGTPPTALLHNAGAELPLRECIAEYLPGLFDPQAVVAMTYWEILKNNYIGGPDETAICLRFGDLAERAVDLLKKQQGQKKPPTREMQGRIFIAQRRGGRWLEA